MSTQHGTYYLPEPSYWPIVGSIALFSIMLGAANWLHDNSIGPYFFAFGFGLLIFMICGWLRKVIHESLAGYYDEQMDRSYRWGMVWFIFSEVMFFAAFFGALFYIRFYAVPWLGGEGTGNSRITYSGLTLIQHGHYFITLILHRLSGQNPSWKHGAFLH